MLTYQHPKAEAAIVPFAMQSESKTLEILLVEDNLPDIILTEKAFERGRHRAKLYSVRDGEEALAFLRREGTYSAARRPDLILLDINLPRKSGYEVLEEIKRSDDLRSIPVIILSSSEAEQDISRSYHLHANSYLVKPASLSKFVELVNALEEFWFSSTRML